MTTAAASTTLSVGDERHGFSVKKISDLKNLRATALELEHLKTGARLLHVQSEDSENLFCVAFRTPPSDDTGLPHILEHSVLAGSRRYPVKDPFVEMVKMSMATFINAMTYSDKTVYPVASNVRQDFYNLAEVYCDAVFHPLLTENTFKQEGHHLEFDGDGAPSNKLIVKGIVYNEMKGAFSSPDQVVDRVSVNGLFPDTPYGKESGGDPEAIPELSYSEFKRFYEDLYHPSNSFIFIYGDIPTVDHLAFLEKQLEGFEHREIDTNIPRQPLWKRPQARREVYPVGKDDELTGKTFVTVNWWAGDGTDALEVLSFKVLDHLLLGHSASPLRKALIDSKLGEDLSDSGFMAGRLESSFHVGLKGSEPEREQQIVDLILDTLKKIASEGMSRDTVDAAFHQLAFRYLEIQSMFPLWLMDRAYGSWIYGADPLVFLRADEHLKELKSRYVANPGLFSELIRKRLIDNPHRLTITFVPDRDFQAKKDAAFEARMEERKAALSDEEKARIASEAKELEKLQGIPNSPQALATLPQLKTSDLPKKPQRIPTETVKLNDKVDLLRNDVFSNGINYFQLDLDLAGLPKELYAYLPLYQDCISKMGAAGLDYAKTAERVEAQTGRVRFWTEMSSHVTDASRIMRRGRYSVKFLDEKAGDALDVFRDLFFEMDPTDEERLKDVLTMSKAEHRSSLVSHGLELALRHAGRGLNALGALAEVTGGVPQTRLVERLADEFDARKEGLIEKLLAIRAFMGSRGKITASFTGSDKAYDSVSGALRSWSERLKVGATPGPDELVDIGTGASQREGLATPSEVAFCAQVMPAPPLSHPDASLLNVATRLLSLGYMWEEVRIKGGAYGGGCGYSGLEQAWHFYSYRDPRVKKTLDIFAGLIDYVKAASWSQADIDRAIIGTAKHAERPIRPSSATSTALWRYINGDTQETREKRYQAVLRSTPAEVKRALLELFEVHADRSAICVLSGREKLEEANKEMPDTPLIIEEIMK